MSENNTTLLDRLESIENHLRLLEQKIDRKEMREAAVQPWQYLVRRQHPWRQQLYVKGRNLTARQLVGSMKANRIEPIQYTRGGWPRSGPNRWYDLAALGPKWKKWR
jgi:hypothetical protein